MPGLRFVKEETGKQIMRGTRIIAVVFELLCSMTDCVRLKIDRRVLAAGYCLGTAAGLQRIWTEQDRWYNIVAAVLPGLMLLLLSGLTEEKIGRGDGDMVLVLGLLLGVGKCTAVLCAASFFSAIYAGVGLVAGKLGKASRLAFAPFLMAGVVVVWMICETGFFVVS